MFHLIERLMEIVLRKDYDYAEFQGAVIAILWGMWLVVAGSRLAASIVQHILAAVFPPRLIGVAFIVGGAYQLWALLGNSPGHRRKAAMTACFLWLFTAIIVARQDWWELVPVPLFFAFALGAAWSFLRVTVKDLSIWRQLTSLRRR